MPAAAGNNCEALVFDRHFLSYGTAIDHTPGTGEFTIKEPGVYVMSFQGNFAPVTGASFPFTLTLYMDVDGTMIQSGAAPHVFNTSVENQNMAFSSPFEVSSAPVTVSVRSQGGTYLYNTVGITIYKLGEIPV